MEKKQLRPQNLKLFTTLEEDEFTLPDWTFDEWCQAVDASLKSGKPNIKERKKGVKYISGERDKLLKK